MPLYREDVVRRAAIARAGDRGAGQAAVDPEAVLQGRDSHAALRPAQVVRLVLPRAGRRRRAADQDATGVPAAKHGLWPDPGLPQGAAAAIWKYGASGHGREDTASTGVFFCMVILSRLQQDAAGRDDLSSLGLPLLGPQGPRQDSRDREISSHLPGKEVPRHSGGSARRQSYRDDDHGLPIVQPRAGRRIRNDPAYIVYRDI